MKKGLHVVLILCFLLFVAGAIILVIGLARGGKMFFTIDYFNHKVNTSGTVKMIEGDKELSEYSSLDIDVNAAEVRVVEGDGYKVKYALYEDNEPTIGVEDKTLKISTSINSNTFSFELFGNNAEENKSPYIEITVPAGTKFENAEISTNAGDIKLDGYDITTLFIESNAGSADLSNLSVATLNIDVDYGQVDIDDIEADELKIKANAGSADITGLTAESADVDMNCGGLDISSSEIDSLTAKLNLGNAKVDETRIDKVDIDTNAGNVDLKMIGEEADYYIDVDVSAGDFMLNGKKQESNYSANSGKERSIKVESDAGSVSIDF